MKSIHVFTYGTLMFDEVWNQVVTKHYGSSAARAEHFVRRAVKGEHYPAMIPKQDMVVEGRVYFNVLPRDLSRLDRFEGHQYSRCNIEVTVKGESMIASTYLWRPSLQLLLADSLWDPSRFERKALALFRKHYSGFDI